MGLQPRGKREEKNWRPFNRSFHLPRWVPADSEPYCDEYYSTAFASPSPSLPHTYGPRDIGIKSRCGLAQYIVSKQGEVEPCQGSSKQTDIHVHAWRIGHFASLDWAVFSWGPKGLSMRVLQLIGGVWVYQKCGPCNGSRVILSISVMHNLWLCTANRLNDWYRQVINALKIHTIYTYSSPPPFTAATSSPSNNSPP